MAIVEDINFREFPSTRYRGSKRKLLPWLFENFKNIEFSSALDVFGGTGSVSYLLKKMGKEVTYNDFLSFNHTIGRALIQNDTTVLNEKDIALLTNLRVDRRKRGSVTKHFKGYYFTDDENIWIDAVVELIRESFPGAQYKADLAMYALFQTCLTKRPFNLFHRKNLYLREAKIKRSFGNKATWDKPIESVYLEFVHEANKSVFKGSHRCRSIRQDALEKLDRKYDLVYLDPPYLKQGKTCETADYSRVYHFLEGLSRYHEWTDMIDFSTATRRLSSNYVFDAINKKTIYEYLNQLFDLYDSSTIVLSYKKFGAPSIESIVRWLKDRKRKVTVKSVHYSYALNSQNGDAERNRECLIIAQ